MRTPAEHSNISFWKLNGEAILARLDDLGVAFRPARRQRGVASKASAVLQAMNIPYSQAMGAILFFAWTL